MMDRLENFDGDDLAKYIKPPKIKIFGIGGAGNNIIERLYVGNINGVETIALNTDATHLSRTKASVRKVIGAESCKGRGAGGDPHVGRRAAEETEDDLKEYIEDSDMVFVIAGMGGGTGTGAAPIIAKMATEMEKLVIGVSILPFKVEGAIKRKVAKDGVLELKENCDTVIELDNENLNEFETTQQNYSVDRTFGVMSDLVTNMVKELSEIITLPSVINVDYADINKVLRVGGRSKIMYGHSNNSDPGSVIDSLLGNPLIGGDYQGSERVVLHIQAGNEFTLRSYHEIVGALSMNLSENNHMISGYRLDPEMGNAVKVVMIVSAIPDDDDGDVLGSAFVDNSDSGSGPDNYGNALGIPMVN